MKANSSPALKIEAIPNMTEIIKKIAQYMPTDNISRSLSNWVKNTIFKSKNLYFMHTCINVIKYYMSFLPYLKICGLATISTNPSKQSHQHCSCHCVEVKMKNQILPNGGISDPHFLRVHRNLRFPVRICQLYRNDQQLQLKVRKIIILATIRL